MTSRHSTLLVRFAIVAMGGAVACARQPAPSSAPTATPNSSRVGEFVWQDLMTEDVEKSRTFYEQMFGWTFERTERFGRPYLIARFESRPIAGIAQVERRRPDQPVSQWISYLAVADIDAVAARMPGLGGQVLVGPTDVRKSRAAVAVDPQGAPIGIVELGPDAELRQPSGGPNAPIGTFIWRDYLAKDVERARTFYTDVAGLGADRQTGTAVVVHYVLTSHGSMPVAGVIPIAERPIAPTWLPYIRVDDPMQAATRAEQLGGRILLKPSPQIRNGSVAVVTDPNGAPLALQKWPF
jgi:hypothetical protein